MKAKAFINSQLAVNNAIKELLSIEDVRRGYLFTLEEHKGNRTLAQNNLYWLWINYISEQVGESEKDLHYHFRIDFLCPIYLTSATNKQQRSWVEEFLHITELDDAFLTKRHFERLSTTWANTKQFTEYLNKIDKHFAANGMPLPHPEDLYYQAQGRAK